MRPFLPSLLLIAGLLLPLSAFAQCPELLWSDEFDGTSLNTDDWNYQTGDGCTINICGWGNDEKQYYQAANAVVSDGTLKIIAKLENVGGKAYTSARINTMGKQDFRYGRMEARIKLPEGRGTWPAFWMLSTEEVYGIWPQSGEIDIMEYVGSEPEEVLGTIHYGQPFPNNSFQGSEFRLLEGEFHEDFHTFAVEWEQNELRWFVDDILYSTKRPSNLGGENWPFDQDFHFLLNLAIGGTLGGSIDNTIFPATMEVDYVRVYDGNKPYLSGKREVAGGATNVSYRLGNVPAGTVVNWTAPEGATIVSGQGAPAVRIDWGTTSGPVIATVDLPCGTQTLEMPVAVDVPEPLVREFSFENFDDEALAILDYTDGTLTEVSNPTPNEVNNSALSGRYVRDGSTAFDVIVYRVNSIDDADAYYAGEKQIVMDVLTQASVNSEIVIQLESNAALGTNYPVGRHSRYTARTREQGSWHRLVFEPLDRPDTGTPGSVITKMIMLFQPNSISSSTFYYDNLDSYIPQEATNVAAIPAAGLSLSLTPNPATDRTWINFELADRARVQVVVYDLQGRRISQLPQRELAAGRQQLEVPLPNVPAGVYTVQLRVGTVAQSVRLVKE